MQVISHAAGESGSHCPSAVHNSFHGGVCGWQHTCSVFSDGRSSSAVRSSVASAAALLVGELARHVALRVALGDVATLVVELLAAGQPELELGLARG